MKRVRGVRKLMRRPVMWLATLLTLGVIVTTCTHTGTFELTHANVTQLDGASDVRVPRTNEHNTTALSVEWISGEPGTPGFINELAYNSATTVTASTYNGSDVTSSWTRLGSKNVDGFGSFSTDVGNGPTAQGSREGIDFPIVFTLANEITDIPDNGNGAAFVVHVGGYPSDCSGFVADGTSTGPTSDKSCGTRVPEPSASLLLCIGLVGIGVVRHWGPKLRRSNA